MFFIVWFVLMWLLTLIVTQSWFQIGVIAALILEAVTGWWFWKLERNRSKLTLPFLAVIGSGAVIMTILVVPKLSHYFHHTYTAMTGHTGGGEAIFGVMLYSAPFWIFAVWSAALFVWEVAKFHKEAETAATAESTT